MNYRTSAELKAYARGKLLGKYGVTVGALALEVLIFSILGQVIVRVVDRNTIEGMLLYCLIMMVVSLISVVFEVGELVIFMKIACGDKPLVGDLFKGFKLHPDKAIVVGLIRLALEGVWFIPSIVALGVAFALDFNAISVMILMLAVMIGLIGSIYIRITLSQMLFILLDFPDYTASEIVNCSRELMKGRKGTYLYIMISFLPLYILSMLSFGIAHMLVLPYVRMTQTEFYMDNIRGPETEQPAEDSSQNYQGFEAKV